MDRCGAGALLRLKCTLEPKVCAPARRCVTGTDRKMPNSTGLWRSFCSCDLSMGRSAATLEVGGSIRAKEKRRLLLVAAPPRDGRPQAQGEHPVLAEFAVRELRVEENSAIALRVLFIRAQRGAATCRRIPGGEWMCEPAEIQLGSGTPRSAANQTHLTKIGPGTSIGTPFSSAPVSKPRVRFSARTHSPRAVFASRTSLARKPRRT